MADRGKGERARPSVAAWVDAMLEAGLQMPEGLPAAERALRLEAARKAVAELAPEEAGLDERILAVQAVIADSAAMDWMARSNAPDLPSKERHAALDSAIRYMELFTRQLRALSAAGAQRRRADALAKRLAAKASRARDTAAEANAETEAKPASPATPGRRKDGSWLH